MSYRFQSLKYLEYHIESRFKTHESSIAVDNQVIGKK